MGDSVILPLGKPASPPAADEVQVWSADLRQPLQRLEALAATLAADERERAAQFRFPTDRDRFIAGRGLLRELLGSYLNRPPAALRFTQGPHGKPALADADARSGLHFNLSHSGDQALYAVAYRELGVDLERADRVVNCSAIAERICTRREWVVLQALPADQLQEAFLACWTRKEAVAKALGGGLAMGLRRLEACFPHPDMPNGRVHLHDEHGRSWSVLNLSPGPGWIGALAAAGTDWCRHIQRWV